MNPKKSLCLLIVDDEVLETEYLLTLLQRSDFAFSNVSIAFSMEMAQGVLKNQPVDVMLCDIEMPRGSGLDLLQWVRKENIPVEVVITTCHPEFAYAQQAMAFASVDYLLKPISLDQLNQGLSRAVEALQKNRAAQHYLRSETKMRDMLFLDLMQGGLPVQKEALAAQMAELGLDYSPEEKMVPLYFRLDRTRCAAQTGGDFAQKTVLLNIVQDILFDFQVVPWSFFPEEDAFFTAFRLSDLRGTLGSFCQNRLKKLMNSSWELLLLPMACFVGKLTAFINLPECFQALQESSRSFFACIGEVCQPSVIPPQGSILSELHSADWVLMLEHGQFKRIRREIEDYLAELESRRIVYADEVFAFSQQLTRAVLRCLQEMQIDADEVLTKAQQQELMMRGKFFLEDFTESARRLLDRLERELERYQGESQITRRIAAYIESHVEEDLDRGSLARQFGLSPEHLSRLFHQNMGVSLVSFITKTKLEFCRRMFDTTDCSVRQASERVGYTNFSYFSKLFRSVYGCTPQQYQEQNRWTGE